MNSEFQTFDLPFYKLSDNQDLILFLIQKELQGSKFTYELDRLGFDTSVYGPDFGVVILSLIGFSSRSDELWDWYYQMVESFVDKVDLWNSETSRRLAMDVYFELRTKLRLERGSG